MFTKALSAAVALAALVSAQTSTSCNPLSQTCPNDPAFGGTASCDFTKGACDSLKPMAGTSGITYGSNGAKFTITQDGQAPTFRSDNYLFFGRVDIVVQAALGQGIVTSAVLQSDDLDEIDWEWVGGDNAQAQSNYFSKGDTSTYDRGAYHAVSSPLTSFHTYSILWTPSAVQWIVDGNTVRTLNAADAKGGSAFPQTPMQVKLGTWVGGGANNAPGTVTWAGGKTDFSKAPFNAYYKSITITDFAGAASAGQSTNAKEYVYGDKSGSASSIKIIRGDGSSGNNQAVQPSSTGGIQQRETTTYVAPEATSEAPATTSVVKPETKYPTTTQEAVKDTTTAPAPEKTTVESKTTVVKETTTESAPAETKPAETKPAETKPAAYTTFSTVTAPSYTTPSGSKPTGGSSSGSGSGNSTSSTTSTSSSGAGQTTTPVPASAATRMIGNTILAAAGFVVLQLLI